jgi:hypothetical protein
MDTTRQETNPFEQTQCDTRHRTLLHDRHKTNTTQQTEQAKGRRARLGKGAGDEDGGGGVYKGSKKKRTGEGVRARKDVEDGGAFKNKKLKNNQ